MALSCEVSGPAAGMFAVATAAVVIGRRGPSGRPFAAALPIRSQDFQISV
jgi:hypothetical protein